MALADLLTVELAWDAHCETWQVPLGTTVRGVIERSRLAARWPALDLARNRVGIYGKLVDPDALVANGDRVEVYRPLLADPKERRRQRSRGDRAGV